MFKKSLLALIISTSIIGAPTLCFGDEEDPSPIKIEHIVVFGNSHSDTGNTRELFDELAGRTKPSRLREDVKYHGPDIIDAGSSLSISAGVWAGIWYMNWDKMLTKAPIVQSYMGTTRLAGVSVLASLLYNSGLGHWLASPADLLIDRSQLLLQAILWLYPGVGLPVLPPGQLYDKGGRFTNGPRVWAEMLASRFNLNPDEPSQFLSLAYAGSHVRQRLSENEMLSFSDWVSYLDIGKGVANTLLSKSSSSSQKESFWSRAAENMSKEGRNRFEGLIKKGVPSSFEFMVEDYGNREKYAGLRDPASTLYLVAHGSDDYIIDDAQPEDVIDALKGSLKTLIERDEARHIVINQISPLRLPALAKITAERKQHIQELVDEHNYQIDSLINELREEYKEVKIILFSGDQNINEHARQQQLSLDPCLHLAGETHADPDKYTIIKVPVLSKKTIFTDPITEDGSSLQAAYRFVGKSVARCNNPDQHLFYDNFNLTSRGHKLVADLVCDLLAENGYQCK